MPQGRRNFRRETERARRDALIAAAVELVAEGGAQQATVRAIAERAGVTPGLIRHYFNGKDDLTRAAYSMVVGHMTSTALRVASLGPPDPASRLSAFVIATLSPPVASEASLRRWSAFLHLILSDPAMRQTHEAGYTAYRDVLHGLISALPRDRSDEGLHHDAIACNALLDGLWLEASAIPDHFARGEVVRIGLDSVGALLRFDLPGPSNVAGRQPIEGAER